MSETRSEGAESAPRRARADDLARLTEIYNHYVATSHVTFDVAPLSPAVRRPWLDQFGRGPHQCWVAEVDGTVAGYACSTPFRARPAYATSVEVSVYVDAALHGRGLSRRLYAPLLAALDAFDLHRAYACIALPNPASVALHESLGFRRVGLLTEVGRKFGRYWDVAYYEKRLARARRA